jgi:hypothetical protein
MVAGVRPDDLVDLTASERDALELLGWPAYNAYTPRGKILAILATNPGMTEAEAYRSAGVRPNTARKWKEREAAFADALTRAGGRPPEGSGAPFASADEVAWARSRYERAMATCAAIGPGPWHGNERVRQRNTPIYRESRKAAELAVKDLRRFGVSGEFPLPPPLGEYPRQPRRPDRIDVAAYRRRYMPGSGALRPQFWEKP